MSALANATVGLGTLLLKESCQASVSTAVQSGYQLIDTGEHYGNLDLVGAALKAESAQPLVVLKLSGLPAGDYGPVRTRLTSMLEKLGVTKVGTQMRGSAPASECIAQWATPEPTLQKEEETKESGSASTEEVSLLDESAAAPLALLAALAFYA